MDIKKQPIPQPDFPEPAKGPELPPAADPEAPLIPEEEDPDYIPDEEPLEPPPFEMPAPGEGP